MDFAENGVLENGKRTNLRGVAFLTTGYGPYGSAGHLKPSERGFSGDLRIVEGKMDKEKSMGDQIDKDILLKDAQQFMFGIVSKIELLLKEYDDWKNSFDNKREGGDWDLDYVSDFKAMSEKVCAALEKIKGEIN